MTDFAGWTKTKQNRKTKNFLTTDSLVQWYLHDLARWRWPRWAPNPRLPGNSQVRQSFSQRDSPVTNWLSARDYYLRVWGLKPALHFATITFILFCKAKYWQTLQDIWLSLIYNKSILKSISPSPHLDGERLNQPAQRFCPIPSRVLLEEDLLFSKVFQLFERLFVKIPTPLLLIVL